MRRTAVAVLVLAAGLPAGCGEDGPRDRVDAYIRAANAVQQRSEPRLDEANRAYAGFAKGELTGERAVERLVTAERAIRVVHGELGDLRPPVEARALHRRLLAAVQANADLAAESTVLAEYLPAAGSAVRPTDGLNRRLRARLDRARSPEAQGRALERYASGIDGVLAKMRALRPAPVVRATHQSQLRRLRAVSRLARRLRLAVEQRDSAGAARLLLRFRRLSRPGRAGSRLSRASIVAYNERYKDVLRLQAAAQHERARLDRGLED